MKPRQHPHTAMIRQWLDDDSLVVQFMAHYGEWETCVQQPAWNSQDVYRFKPKTIKIGDVDCALPTTVSEVPNDGGYYLPKLYFSNKEDAEQFRKAVMALVEKA